MSNPKVFNRPVRLGGHKRVINAITIQALEYDGAKNILLATGLTTPTGAGYAKGCLFINTSAATGVKGLYENTGTTASASFNLISSKLSGKITWSGSGATLATNVVGVLAGDIVVATIQTKPTQAAYLVGVVPTTNTITIELSAANTANNAVIAYQVLSAGA